MPECSLKWKSALERLSPPGSTASSTVHVKCFMSCMKKPIGVESSAVAICKTYPNAFLTIFYCTGRTKGGRLPPFPKSF